ncbi:MAG TPA: amino acid ABC transporter permease [Thermoleophilia bacterium]|nr:amino acid ABC transporter permease [Thermoleophilia bacterium]HQG02763.1 amino acid ABC transporter permease [Thermoleophilia bacterium]HQG54162.1 amino acid ABC transporter permease [Thermoleophilia bacterium]HQJ97064.1 amino acid ABC transporter permease [Thermoleophilia bacterium]
MKKLVLTILALVLVLGAMAPAASAAGKLPEVTQGSPYDGMAYEWGVTAVQVYYMPGSSPVDPLKCELYVNGERVTPLGDPVDSQLAQGASLQFNLPEDFQPPKGELEFRAVLVTKAGDEVSYDWTYTYGGQKRKPLIDFALMRDWFTFIAQGALVTIELTVLSILFATLLALLGALGRLSKSTSAREAWTKYRSWTYMVGWVGRMVPYGIATFYTSLFRGTPLLLQIIFIYLAIPGFNNYAYGAWGFKIPEPGPFASAAVALSLNYGAYLTEVWRAGIQAVPKGQTEAAWALGMTGMQTWRRITLPQAFKIVIPAIGNDFIALIKDTSLASTIALPELLQKARLVGGRTYDFLSPLLVAAAVYWALTIFFSFWQARLERRLERDTARG